jgi:type II secretory pathway component PulF
MSKDLENFYYNLALMLDSGMPVLRTIEPAGQSCRGKIRGITPEISALVSQGDTLPDAMKKFPNIFPGFDIVAVEAADRSGSLPEVFRLLSEWHHFTNGIKGKIRAGLVLPAAVLVIAAFIAPLPSLILHQYTFWRALTESAEIMGMFVIPAAVIFALIRYMPKGGQLRSVFDVVILRVPYLGKAIKHYAVSSFCYTFYILYKAALPITDCLELAIQSMPNAVVAERLKGGCLNAASGMRIADGFKNPFVDGFVEIWAMGEESGQLDVVAKKLAQENKEASQLYFERFAFWLPKVVYFFVCLMMLVLIMRNAAAIGRQLYSF